MTAPTITSMDEYYRWFYTEYRPGSGGWRYPDVFLNPLVPKDTYKADIALLAWLHEQEKFKEWDRNVYGYTAPAEDWHGKITGGM